MSLLIEEHIAAWLESRRVFFFSTADLELKKKNNFKSLLRPFSEEFPGVSYWHLTGKIDFLAVQKQCVFMLLVCGVFDKWLGFMVPVPRSCQLAVSQW